MKLLACFVPVLVVLFVQESMAKPGLLESVLNPFDQGSSASSNAQSVGSGLSLGPLSVSGSFASSSSSASGGQTHSESKASASSSVIIPVRNPHWLTYNGTVRRC